MGIKIVGSLVIMGGEKLNKKKKEYQKCIRVGLISFLKQLQSALSMVTYTSNSSVHPTFATMCQKHSRKGKALHRHGILQTMYVLQGKHCERNCLPVIGEDCRLHVFETRFRIPILFKRYC